MKKAPPPELVLSTAALKPASNPILGQRCENPTASASTFDRPPTFTRPRTGFTKREIRDARRMKTASEAIAGFDQGTEIYGFTNGQYSALDLIRAALEYTGTPAEFDACTWTTCAQDISNVAQMVTDGQLSRVRFLLDLSFQRRDPETAGRIRALFGPDAMRVAMNHAKFYLLAAGDWRITVISSLNLNFNARFENFSMVHDPALWNWHRGLLDQLWTTPARTLADARPKRAPTIKRDR